MAFCSQCGAELPADATVCPSCKATLVKPTESAAGAFEPQVEPWDHTAEFDAADISNTKVYAMCAYLLGLPGIIIALLVKEDSPFLKFHVKESTKIMLVELIVTILTCLLCWTCIVPIVGIVLCIITTVLRIIAFFQVCNGVSKEQWLIRSLTFLK